MKFSDTTDEKLRQVRIAYVEKRWSDLADRYRVLVDEAARYLFLVNSGGAIATLSYMGALKTVDPIPGARLMLIFFLCGVLLVGVGRALGSYRSYSILMGWSRSVSLYYSNAIDWDDLLKQDAEKGKPSLVTDAIAWSCFACFVSGLAVAYRDLIGSAHVY